MTIVNDGGGMLFLSGRFATPSGGLPSLPDIGHGLAQLPRFGGQTVARWTVAHHVLWMDDFYLHTSAGEASPNGRAALLLHDAHEVFTGDIPTHFKTPDMKARQETLDRRIMGRYFPTGLEGYRIWEEFVHLYDRMALLAEAVVVGPLARMPEDAQRESLNRHFFGARPQDDAVEFLRGWIRDAALREAMVTPGAEWTARVVGLL